MSFWEGAPGVWGGGWKVESGLLRRESRMPSRMAELSLPGVGERRGGGDGLGGELGKGVPQPRKVIFMGTISVDMLESRDGEGQGSKYGTAGR